ncbi:MAG: fused MFS/spermidine synthase [Chloroflexota bacterium]
MTDSYGRSFLVYLVGTAVICGAIIMVLEVLGSRVVGPFFGVSLFVWTSLITVTLVALAAGYALGGIMSDKKESPDYLYIIILISGFLVLLIPLIKGAVLKAFQPLGLRSGAFLSATVLFGPSLLLLGCVSPYLVKLAVRETRKIGRIVGVFYALSTVGSFVGTVLTGFVLIAYLRVNTIFMIVGTMLVLLAVSYFVIFRKKIAALAVCLAAVPLLAVSVSGEAKSKVMPNGTTVTEIYNRSSFYGAVKVLDYSYGQLHTREMTIDGLVQGGMDVRTRQSVYGFSYVLGLLPYRLNPSGSSCLVIGLGAGLVPAWFEERGIRTDVVDINPDVVNVAKRYFGFRLAGDIYIEDARYFLTRVQKKYDYIILDVYTGDTTPAHLLSREALQLVKERLTERGILAINLMTSLTKESFMTRSILKTLGTVFRTVEMNPLYPAERLEGVGNAVIVAYDFPFVWPEDDIIRDASVHFLAKEEVSTFAGKRFRFPGGVEAVVLTDEYNPVDFYDVWLKEKVRRAVLETTDWDMLID